jgi:hypothetical protein
MHRLYRKLLISFLIFTAFYTCGHIALYLESWHNSVIASSAIFGTSFAGSGCALFKLYNDFFT